MKKILCAVLAILILVSVLAGCGHEHIWEGGDCTTPAVCSECGEEGDVTHSGGVWAFRRLDEEGGKMFYKCAVCQEQVEKKLDYEEMAVSQLAGEWLAIDGSDHYTVIFEKSGRVMITGDDADDISAGIWKLKEGRFDNKEDYSFMFWSEPKYGCLVIEIEMDHGGTALFLAPFDTGERIDLILGVFEDEGHYRWLGNTLVRR